MSLVFFKVYLKDMVSYSYVYMCWVDKKVAILRQFDLTHSWISESTSLLHSEFRELALYLALFAFTFQIM